MNDMNFTRSYAVFLRYVYLVRGNATRFVQIFVWAALDIVLWGFITKYLDSVGQANFSFVPVLLGAVLLWDFLTRVSQGVSTPFLEDVWARNLLNYFASPLSISEYLLGLTCASIVTSAVGFVVMFTLAFLFFGLSLLVFGAALAGFIAILFFSGVALGIFSTALILRFGPSAEWFVWPLPTVLSPFVGVFYPLTVLPQWMQWIARVLPLSYVFDGVRGIITGSAFSQSDMFVGVLLSFVYVALAYIFFIRVYKKAVRTGAIARYSAESYS
jgi:ABC-2 type transport system permease protein